MKRLQKNELGLGHLLLILMVVVVAAVVGLVGWVVVRGNNNVTVDEAVQKTCLAEVKDTKFCKFAAHLNKIENYKLTADVTASSVKSSFVVTSSKDGNSQMVVSSGGQEVGDVVVFNSITYAKDPTDNAWIKYASSAANKPEIFDLKKEIGKDSFKGDKGQKLEYKSLGEETCGNLTCFKYQIIDPQMATAQTHLWFDTKNYLLRTLTSKDGESNAQFTMTYEAVSISQPSPVKQTVN